MTKITRLLSTLLVGTLMSLGLKPSAQAQTTLNYTNTADAWLTSTSWSPANNWNSGAVKTNAATANVRINIGTNFTASQAVSVTYNATMGTTIIDNASVATRGFVIGSASSTTGAVTITGGTLIIRNGSTADSFLVGSPAASGAGSGTLTLSGGDLIYTNGTTVGFGLLCVPYRGGSTTGGPNFAQGTFTIGGGSVATIERTFFGFTASEANAQCTGTINLNSGGTLSTRNISARDGDASQMTSIVNFNGGTLRVLGNNVASATTPFIFDTGSSLTLNVQAGGAIIDTAGFNAFANRGLSGIGGLTKTGNGLLTFTNTSSYSGSTVVNGGGLSFFLPMSSSSLTLSNGTSASIVALNNSWTNTFTSVTNSTLNFALGTVTTIPSATTAVFKTSTLNVSGANTINITSVAGVTPGSYRLVDYTSSGNRFGGGSFVLGTLPPGVGATLIDGPNDVSLNITYVALVWKANFDTFWATNGVQNWVNSFNVNAAYQETGGGYGDAVSFTDAAGSFYTVNVTNNVKPSSIVIDHTSASAVTLTGVGQITGTNGITKNGTGTTLLGLSNTFSGAVNVNNGILQVVNAGALGSTNGITTTASAGTVSVGDGLGTSLTVVGETITLNGVGFGGSLGQLRGTPGAGVNTWAGPIILAASNGRIGTEINGNLTVAGPIFDNGSNYFVLYRPGNGGTITAAYAANSCGGTATFCGSSAVVKLGVANGFSTNVLQVGIGTIDLNGFNQTVSGVDVFSGNGVILNNGAGASALTISVGATNAYVAQSVIQDGSQPVSLVKSGSGRQTLNFANTYTGNTTINAGELRLGSGSSLGSTAVSVNSGGLLSVATTATVAGTITVNSGGTLSPGIPFVLGALTNSSTVTLNSGSTNLFHIDTAGSSSDRLVANSLAYGGTLVVTNQGSTALTNGQVFQLVNATTPTGTFANAASVAILPGGTGSFNPVTGQLTITALAAAPTLNVVQSGNTLQFSWTGATYRLQSQTNSLASGLGTNWSDYFTGSTNPVTVPISAANQAVFFRLISQ